MKARPRLKAKVIAWPDSTPSSDLQEALAIFAQMQIDLEHEPEFWALRLFTPEGGLVWRNHASREHFGSYGYFPSPTLPWSGFQTYLTPAALAGLASAFQAAFVAGEMVKHEIVSAPHGQEPHTLPTDLVAVCGNMDRGVIVMCQQPLTASESIPGAA